MKLEEQESRKEAPGPKIIQPIYVGHNSELWPNRLQKFSFLVSVQEVSLCYILRFPSCNMYVWL
jgi:hypothetical protein